jgi:flagellar motor switch protein FliM
VAFLLLNAILRMHKSGLIALAETYGLDRRGLQQLKLIAEGFFDALRDDLAGCAPVPIKLSGLAQSIASFKDVCLGVPHARIVLVGSSTRVAALVRADSAFARALVDCLISGTILPNAEGRGLTAIEQNLFSNTMATACLRSATRTLAGPVTSGDLRRVDPVLAESVSDPSEQFGLARITCSVGNTVGILELALPLARFSKPREHSIAIHPPATTSTESKARARLVDANAELVAVLGQAMMPLDAVRALGRGSILSLRPLKDGLPYVELRCENQVLFSGAVVEHRGWRRFLIQHTGASDERTDQRALDA